MERFAGNGKLAMASPAARAGAAAAGPGSSACRGKPAPGELAFQILQCGPCNHFDAGTACALDVGCACGEPATVVDDHPAGAQAAEFEQVFELVDRLRSLVFAAVAGLREVCGLALDQMQRVAVEKGDIDLVVGAAVGAGTCRFIATSVKRGCAERSDCSAS